MYNVPLPVSSYLPINLLFYEKHTNGPRVMCSRSQVECIDIFYPSAISRIEASGGPAAKGSEVGMDLTK